MGIQVHPSLIDWDHMKNSGRNVEVEAVFLDWSKVVQAAKDMGVTIEEVLGIDPIPPISKPSEDTERDFNELLEDEVRRTGRSKDELLQEARDNPTLYKTLESRAARLGVDIKDLFKIDRIILRYSSHEDEEVPQ